MAVTETEHEGEIVTETETETEKLTKNLRLSIHWDCDTD